MKQTTGKRIRSITVTAIMSALGYILMLLEFPLPIIPSFIKLDFSEIPAIITTFALGPLSGVAVCFFKNLLHLLNTTSAGVGELSNFILGSVFVVIAGLIYKRRKNFKRAIIGVLIGAAVMALFSVLSNYFFVYPFYVKFYGMPYEAIVGAYSAILPAADTLLKALLIFNVPFTFLKGLIDAAVCFACYKRLSPIIKGNNA